MSRYYDANELARAGTEESMSSNGELEDFGLIEYCHIWPMGLAIC